MRSLAEVNAGGADDFVGAVGGVLENGEWAIRLAWKLAPFASIDDLHRAIAVSIRTATGGQVIDFLRGYSELTNVRDDPGRLTVTSFRERTSAGLAELSANEIAELTVLNASFRSKHGFPFILAVSGHRPNSILVEFRNRLALGTPEAIEESLAQVDVVVRSRLDRIFGAEVSAERDGERIFIGQ